ncbi:MAG TPA: HEAT repeat domain-containing protein [Gemmataceae bacterium]|nr:HEAT repeat domain-containing protein [Gemmataceae bacterium]
MNSFAPVICDASYRCENGPRCKVHKGTKRTLLGKIYQKVRADLSERLKTLLLRSLQSSDSGRRLAVIIFLSDMATDEHEHFPREQQFNVPDGGAIIRFTPCLVGDLRKLLSQDKDPDVCAAAVRAVVQIEPGTAATIEAVKASLEPTRKVAERLAAAEELGHILRVMRELHRDKADVPRPGIAPGRRLLSLDQAEPILVRAAGAGLKDEDATVRRRCLEAIQQAVEQWQRPTANSPLAREVNERMTAVTRLLADSDLAVRLSAYQVLESAAAARRMIPQLAEELPSEGRQVRSPKGELSPPAAAEPPLGGVLKALPALRKSLSDDEVRIRLASLYVLETLDFDAAPAVAEVVQALKDDKNGFVRWGAARVLNNMAPLESDKAVSALAEALVDTNKTVRLTAVAALQRYGPKAAAAMKPLGKAIQDAEPRMRLGAINALAAIGADARPEADALLLALKDDKTPEVRAAAAKALGQMGRLDAKTMKAIRNALRDPEAAVRQAASDLFLEDLPRFRGKSDTDGKE